MDALIATKQYESRIKELEMKIEAILQAIGLECEYTPESYKLVQPEKGTDN